MAVEIQQIRQQHMSGERTGALTTLPPLSLYFHLPWCVRKCPYCDFNSHEVRAAFPEQEYAAALIADLEQAVPRISGRRVHSIFFGGGTPSIFSPKTIAHILHKAGTLVPLADPAEISLEANPGTVDAARFAGFRDAGVNRLSLGIQSFASRQLAAIGRIHDAAEAHSAAMAAVKIFQRVNFDLMYALPQQTVEEALADITTAIGYGPGQISCYHLTLEPNTAFHHAPPPLPDDDTSAAMEEAIKTELTAHGYWQYEISAFARSGEQCRHNLNYWQYGDYLGIGAGAHSKLSFADSIVRQARTRHPLAYMRRILEGNAVESERLLTREDLGFEFMMNALRLIEGFDSALFEERTGLSLSALEPALRQAEQQGLINSAALRITPTPHGRRFLNNLLQLFLD